MKRKMAIIGGGPSALFLLRRLIQEKASDVIVDIFECNDALGKGMPYSTKGASEEHVTNVSGNEIPDLITPMGEWIKEAPGDLLARYHLDEQRFTDYKVVPRLLFGEYLNDQFIQYLALAQQLNIEVVVHLDTLVTRIKKHSATNQITVFTRDPAEYEADVVVICSGHRWPEMEEGVVDRHFDSPYPPGKLRSLQNRPVILKGCSLTAIDAVRTVARANGYFIRDANGALCFQVKPENSNFRITMRSRHGILPGLRFHLEDPHLSRKTLLSRQTMDAHRAENNGFASLDYIFEENFKAQFKETDPLFYNLIKDWKMEEFISAAMTSFSAPDPFQVFSEEFAASLKSIRENKSEYWKEKLAILSIAMNYPAKYLSAEDTIRFQKHLMPLISIVIAFVPQSSAEEMLALHAADRLFLFAGDEPDPLSTENTFIDCTGQPHLSIEDFPFQDLVRSGSVSQARVRYQHQSGTMNVPGLAITDNFRAIDQDGKTALFLYIMAVPYIGGFNPDYSGLDFCEDASKAIVKDFLQSTS